MKKISVLCVIFIICGLFQAPVCSLAHEVGPGRSYRFRDIGNIPVTMDTMSTIPQSIVYEGFNDWNNKTGKTNFYWGSFANARCYFTSPRLEYWMWGDGVMAQTLVENDARLWNVKCLYGEAGFSSGTVRKAIIEVHPNGEVYYPLESLKRYLVRHELGHVLGLGHVPMDYSIASIMYPTDASQWHEVQPHDVADIHAFY